MTRGLASIAFCWGKHILAGHRSAASAGADHPGRQLALKSCCDRMGSLTIEFDRPLFLIHPRD
jgi:hypothetical protein